MDVGQRLKVVRRRFRAFRRQGDHPGFRVNRKPAIVVTDLMWVTASPSASLAPSTTPALSSRFCSLKAAVMSVVSPPQTRRFGRGHHQAVDVGQRLKVVRRRFRAFAVR
ncbi:hypothetical protein H2136_08145 [Aeromonas hydrophila]|uniref:Uncharacterized protein n=1 Tax=Aeromonas hydrophila TaxID=644 RepID=A0A926FJR8_AERHY|nr:hypothetical protein [Aeromonas hydrophila]